MSQNTGERATGAAEHDEYYIYLAGGKGKVRVDADTWEWASKFKYHDVAGYAGRTVRENGKTTTVLLHREIFGLQPGDNRVVDHIGLNRDKRDCRRISMRITNYSGNNSNIPPLCTNTSGFRGVSRRPNGRYVAHVSIRKRLKHIGTFDDIIVAALVRDHWAKIVYGPGCYLNFPDEA